MLMSLVFFKKEQKRTRAGLKVILCEVPLPKIFQGPLNP